MNTILTPRRLRPWAAIPIVMLTVAACAPGARDDVTVAPTNGSGTATVAASQPSSGIPEDDGDDSPATLTGGLYSVAVGDAGSAALAVSADRVTVESLTPNAGWRVAREDDDDDEGVDLELASDDGSRSITVDGEIDDDGDFEVDVDWSQPAADGTLTVPAGEAGEITLRVQGDRVTIESIDPVGTFEVVREEDDDDDDGDAEVHLVDRDGKTRVELDADVDDGVLTVETDTVIGTDFEQPDDADDEDDASADDNEEDDSPGDEDDAADD